MNAQEEEIDALQSIYPDTVVQHGKDDCILISIDVSLEMGEAERIVLAEDTKLCLSHLPPVQLQVRLPPSYPDVPPEATLKSDWSLGSATWLDSLEAYLPSCMCISMRVGYKADR